VLTKPDIISFARRGYLVCIDPHTPLNALSDEEILRLEALGKLVGAGDLATEFGECMHCSWKDHVHFVSNDEDWIEAHRLLAESHAKTPCTKADLIYSQFVSTRPG